MINALGEQRDLHIRRACIPFVKLEITNRLRFRFHISNCGILSRFLILANCSFGSARCKEQKGAFWTCFLRCDPERAALTELAQGFTPAEIACNILSKIFSTKVLVDRFWIDANVEQLIP